MISGEKILITGPAGRIAFAIAKSLAPRNEVWGVARFSDPSSRQEVEALGVKTRTLDLASGSYGDLPNDFTYLLHLAADFNPDDYDRAISVNAEGTGLLMEHCRKAKAALIMSTVTVYKPNEDPWHAWKEDEPLGDQMVPGQAPYSISKISQEAVARFCARAFNLPTVIARMGSAYGLRGGMPVWHLHAIAEGKPVQTRWDPMPYSPIFDDDIVSQIEPLLGAAGVPAAIVNFCGDEAVSVQQWCAYIGELLGVEPVIEVNPVSNASVGSVGDPAKRISITGPCQTHWREGVRRMAEHFYPDRIKKKA
jgi:nucleoside-diphosphate-sugar epimerase